MPLAYSLIGRRSTSGSSSMPLGPRGNLGASRLVAVESEREAHEVAPGQVSGRLEARWASRERALLARCGSPNRRCCRRRRTRQQDRLQQAGLAGAARAEQAEDLLAAQSSVSVMSSSASASPERVVSRSISIAGLGVLDRGQALADGSERQAGSGPSRPRVGGRTGIVAQVLIRIHARCIGRRRPPADAARMPLQHPAFDKANRASGISRRRALGQDLERGAAGARRPRAWRTRRARGKRDVGQAGERVPAASGSVVNTSSPAWAMRPP